VRALLSSRDRFRFPELKSAIVKVNPAITIYKVKEVSILSQGPKPIRLDFPSPVKNYIMAKMGVT